MPDSIVTSIPTAMHAMKKAASVQMIRKTATTPPPTTNSVTPEAIPATVIAKPTMVTDGNAGTGAAIGATAGALIGGGAGLLAGIGALAIPGIGPVVAAGWLVSTLTGAVTGGAAGAATGGLIGSLTKSGVPEREANVYAEGVRRGGSLVTVRTDDARAFEVERIMDRRRSIDWMERDRTYRSEGWERFDPDAPVYTPPAGAGRGPVRTDRY